MIRADVTTVIFKSTDGGKTFGHGVKIANVTPATQDGLLFLGPGRYMRTIEFPSAATTLMCSSPGSS